VGEETLVEGNEQEIRAAFQDNLERRPDARASLRSARVGNSRLYFGFGEACIDHLIQLADDCIGRLRLDRQLIGMRVNARRIADAPDPSSSSSTRAG
jgi:hypothetical protein